MHTVFRTPTRILVCLGLASLAGCGLISSQDAVTPSVLQVNVENGNNERPVITLYNDDYDCFGVNPVELDEQNSKAQLQIPHKAFTTFQAKWIAHVRAEVGLHTVECDVTATIDSSDLSEITLKTNGSSAECDVAVTGTNADGETRSLPYQKRPLDILQFYTQGPFCDPDSRFQGSSTYSPPRGK